MRQLKLLLAAIALLWAMPCWGKPIDLHGKWEHKKKSIPIGLPMDASIEEANRVEWVSPLTGAFPSKNRTCEFPRIRLKQHDRYQLCCR